jgi:gas vesicle protein
MNLDNNKSAKDYISEAYLQELANIQERAKLMETPADIIAKENVEKTIALSEEILSMNILNEETTNEYDQLNQKIQAKKDEIAKLYGIEIFPESLQAIKSAYSIVSNEFAQYLEDCNSNFESSLQQELEDVENKIAEDTANNDSQVDAIYEEISTKIADNKLETAREQAEYDYTLKRTRKQAQEERAKLIESRELDMQLLEKDVQDRKQACIDKLNEIEQLQAKVDEIPNLIELATIEGAEQKEKELGKDYGYKSSISKKDFDNDIARLQSDLNRLQDKYDLICKDNQELAYKLDKCYAESRQLATDTVKSTGGINILNSDNYNQNGKK